MFLPTLPNTRLTRGLHLMNNYDVPYLWHLPDEKCGVVEYPPLVRDSGQHGSSHDD